MPITRAYTSNNLRVASTMSTTLGVNKRREILRNGGYCVYFPLPRVSFSRDRCLLVALYITGVHEANCSDRGEQSIPARHLSILAGPANRSYRLECHRGSRLRSVHTLTAREMWITDPGFACTRGRFHITSLSDKGSL